MISYEFPLNEKVRTWLRLEELFARMAHFVAHDISQDHHAALLTLFEILEVASRADLKSELMQELERLKRLCSNFQNAPSLSEPARDAVLTQIDQVMSDLLAMVGKTGQHLRDNEWLMSLKQRAVIPGGTCEFDVPSYHYWQKQNADSRRTNLQAWLAPFLPLRAGIGVLLRLMRENAKVHQFTAHQGQFQQMQGGKTAQLLCVRCAADLGCLPEVGANKYVINIRFIAANFAARATLFKQDVPFELSFCSLML